MLDKLKALVKRIRVRMWPLVLALVAALPYVLDYLGTIDLRPIMTYLFGEERGVLFTPIAVILLTFAKQAVHLAPKED